MTVFFDKSRKRWRYDFEQDGQRYARECTDADGTPVQSRRSAQGCENEARRVARVASKLPRANDLTFAQVVSDLSEIWRREADWENKQRYARELVAFFGPATAMASIDGARIQDYIAHALSQPVMVWTGGSSRKRDCDGADRYWKRSGRTRGAATVNRYLPLLRMAFQRAYETRDPVTRQRAIESIPPIKDLPEPKRKARPTPDNVMSDLIAILPDHAIEGLKATLYFGLRRGECFGLQIANVDFDAGGIRLFADDVKDDEDAFLPGSRDAMQFLAQLVDQARERGMKHLITYRRRRKDETAQAREKWRPIKSPKTAWRTAMAKIEASYGKRWRWHDLRASFITQIAMTSGALAAQKLARHSDFQTTQAYIEVADQVTRSAAEKATDRPALRIVRGGNSR